MRMIHNTISKLRNEIIKLFLPVKVGDQVKVIYIGRAHSELKYIVDDKTVYEPIISIPIGMVIAFTLDFKSEIKLKRVKEDD